jgi:hypothetical protein
MPTHWQADAAQLKKKKKKETKKGEGGRYMPVKKDSWIY